MSDEFDAMSTAPYHATEQCHECGEPYWICRMGACPGDFVEDQDECQHEWELRSEHDTWVCCWCDAETTSPDVVIRPADPEPPATYCGVIVDE